MLLSFQGLSNTTDYMMNCAIRITILLGYIFNAKNDSYIAPIMLKFSLNLNRALTLQFRPVL